MEAPPPRNADHPVRRRNLQSTFSHLTSTDREWARALFHFGEDSLSVLSHDVLGAQTGPIAPILTTIDLRAPRSDRATLNPSMVTALRWPFDR